MDALTDGCRFRRPFADQKHLPSRGASSELRVQAHPKYRRRTAIGVVSRVGDELVVERHARGRRERVAVVCLNDPFEPGIGQVAVADEDSQASVVEKLLMDAGDTVDRSGNSDVVILPPPKLPGQRDAYGGRAVDIGEIPRLNVAVGPAGAGEHANVLRNLLLQIDAHSRAAPVDAHGIDIGGLPGNLGDRNCICKASCPPTAEKAGRTSRTVRSTTPPPAGGTPTVRRPNGIRAVGRCAAASSTCRKPQPAGGVPTASISTPAFISSSWLEKSRNWTWDRSKRKACRLPNADRKSCAVRIGSVGTNTIFRSARSISAFCRASCSGVGFWNRQYRF